MGYLKTTRMYKIHKIDKITGWREKDFVQLGRSQLSKLTKLTKLQGVQGVRLASAVLHLHRNAMVPQ